MTHSRKLEIAAAAVAAALAVIAAVVVIAGPSLVKSFFYPVPQGLPPVVSDTTTQVLARLQVTLEKNAPAVARTLQPGLSDQRIMELETTGGFRLSDDFRELYRWHNGQSTNAGVGLLPGERFVPLEEAVAERAQIRQQSSLAIRLFAGHRRSWLHVLEDGAGDGCFFDPDRTAADGAFFFHFAESGDYIWFPALRNFLTGVIESFETQAIKLAADGKSLDENATKTEKIWNRLGKSSGN